VLGAGIQPQVVLFDFVGDFFGIQAGTGHVWLGAQHGWRQYGCKRLSADIEAVFCNDFLDDIFVAQRLHNVVNERELQAYQPALQVDKAGAGDLDGAVFVDQVVGVFSAQLVIVLGRKIELRHIADGFGDDVFVFSGAHRHEVERHVGYGLEQLLIFLINRSKKPFGRSNFVLKSLSFLHKLKLRFATTHFVSVVVTLFTQFLNGT
jgi:hypothetical protein